MVLVTISRHWKDWQELSNKKEHSGSVVVTQIESSVPIDRAWQRAITRGWIFSIISGSIVSQAWCCPAKRSCNFRSSTASLASMSSQSSVLAATWMPCLLSSKCLSLLGESANSNVSHSKVSSMNESSGYESAWIRLRANKLVVVGVDVNVDGSLEEETKRLVDMQVDVMDSGRKDRWWKIDFTIENCQLHMQPLLVVGYWGERWCEPMAHLMINDMTTAIV